MAIRRLLNAGMIITGAVALVIGLFGIFESSRSVHSSQNHWIFIILGTVLFSWGMVVLKKLDDEVSG